MFMSLMEWFMLSALNVQMLYLIAYHGHVNLSQWQFCQLLCLSLSWCTFTKFDARISLCFCVLLEVLVGSALSSVWVYILKYCLHWILLTIFLWGIVAWFFSVGLFSCRCLVDLPGVKTLLLTNQQHQLLKGYVARVRFGTRVRVRDSAIFEKGGCGCGGTRRLKNY